MPSALQSKWDGLSDKLIATFYEVKRSDDKTSWVPIQDGAVVKAPLTESSVEYSLSWQSPFEGAGADKGIPAISAMLQSGALQPYVDPKGKASDVLGKFEGRTGITKLNSIQTFSGMPPVKIQVTALFRAWSNAKTEVENPFLQLMRWALPQKLAPDGAVMSFFQAAKDAVGGAPLDESAVKALLPSEAPVKIAMHYKNRLYSPLVIESIAHPISSPIDKNGDFIELLVPMTLCTLTATDREDFEKSFKPSVGK